MVMHEFKDRFMTSSPADRTAVMLQQAPGLQLLCFLYPLFKLLRRVREPTAEASSRKLHPHTASSRISSYQISASTRRFSGLTDGN